MARYRRRGYGGWAPYVPVAERRRKAEREVAKRQKRGETITPVVITGRTIATTFWGKAWCDNLESYQDYENRLPRGRTYVRNGSVLDLQIARQEVRAMVSGSSLYHVDVTLKALPKTTWKAICQECSSGIDSLVELLQGRFNKGVMDRLCRQDKGLFPKPSDINFSCSCPDFASMCKHIAAVLYGIGARLDENPELLFLLRAVDHHDLLAHIDTDAPLTTQGPDTDKVLKTDDISQLFGLDISEEDGGLAELNASQPAAKTARKSAQPKKPKRRAATGKRRNTPEEAQHPLYAEMLTHITAAGFASVEEFLAMRESPQSHKRVPPARMLRYQSLDGTKTWSGRGRKPTWVIQHLEDGGALEDLEISSARVTEGGGADVKASVTSRKSTRRNTTAPVNRRVQYQNSDGTKTWGGQGRRPTWVVQHLEAGGALADLAIS